MEQVLNWLAEGLMVGVTFVTAVALVCALGMAWAWLKVVWRRRRQNARRQD